MSMHPIAKTLLIVLSVWGVQQVMQARRRRQQTLHTQGHEAVRAWEGEGGAVPISDHRTAATVSPLPATASPAQG